MNPAPHLTLIKTATGGWFTIVDIIEGPCKETTLMDKLTNHTVRRLLATTLLAGVMAAFAPGSWAQSGLSAAEMTDLQYMREEEKLARDLYSAFYGMWNSDIFLNIATAEQRHMDAVGNLLTLYGIADPTVGNGAGEFTSSALQDLYDSLLAQGSGDEVSALAMGVLVEQTDIEDLDMAIAQATQAPVLRVFRNLRRGSENHLAAFNNRLLQFDSNASSGAGFGPGDGTSVFEPYSQTLYIPAIDVTTKSDTVLVYDAYLRVVESIPVTLELLTVTLTSKIPNSDHASYADGLLTIPHLSIGSQRIDSLDDTVYAATFHLAAGESGGIFVLDTLNPLAP